MRLIFLLSTTLLLALLAGCGTDPPTQTPVIIVVTATAVPATPVPPAPPTAVPVPPTPDAAGTAQALAQATIAAEDQARATAAAQIYATQTQVAQQPTIYAIQTRNAQPTQTPVPPRTIELTELSKGFHTADYLAGDAGDTITFTEVFVNHLGKGVRGFQGVIKFFDLFNHPIMDTTITVTDPIAAGASLTYKAEMQYNQFMADQRALRNTNGKDLLFDFQLTSVIYSDGTQEQFP
jgi:hypothetical protein